MEPIAKLLETILADLGIDPVSAPLIPCQDAASAQKKWDALIDFCIAESEQKWVTGISADQVHYVDIQKRTSEEK